MSRTPASPCIPPDLRSPGSPELSAGRLTPHPLPITPAQLQSSTPWGATIRPSGWRIVASSFFRLFTLAGGRIGNQGLGGRGRAVTRPTKAPPAAMYSRGYALRLIVAAVRGPCCHAGRLWFGVGPTGGRGRRDLRRTGRGPRTGHPAPGAGAASAGSAADAPAGRAAGGTAGRAP